MKTKQIINSEKCERECLYFVMATLSKPSDFGTLTRDISSFYIEASSQYEARDKVLSMFPDYDVNGSVIRAEPYCDNYLEL